MSQPGVSARDYTSLKRASALKQDIKGTIQVPEVIGKIDATQWEETLQEQCGAEVLHIDATTGSIPSYHSMPKVISISFAAPSAHGRARDLAENEAFFASLMEPLLSTNYTVLWTTTPAGTAQEPSAEYTMQPDSQESLHMGLKRDLGSGLQQRATNVTLVDGPLFHRYQFFTPGECLPGELKKQWLLTGSRNLHGLAGRLHSCVHPIRRHLSASFRSSHLRGV